MKKHAKYGFSSRERWSNCPISIHLATGCQDKSSPAAQEGTIAHAFAEYYVSQKFDPLSLPDEYPDATPPEGLDINDPDEWNADMRICAKAFANYLWDMVGDRAAILNLEYKVNVPSISPHLAGTTDCAIWVEETEHLIIADYKYGFDSVDVGTENDPNPQVAGYAYATAETLGVKPKRLSLVIFQPRRPFGTPDQCLDITYASDWLEQQGEKLRQDVQRIESEPGAPKPGEHCKYCPAIGVCPVTHNALQAALEVHGGLRNLLDIPEDEAIELFAARAALKAFTEDINERVTGLAKTGHKRLVYQERAGRRVWSNPKQVVETCIGLGKTDMLKPPNISDADQQLPAEVVASLVKRSAPSRTLKVVDAAKPSELVAMFKKYVK